MKSQLWMLFLTIWYQSWNNGGGSLLMVTTSKNYSAPTKDQLMQMQWEECLSMMKYLNAGRETDKELRYINHSLTKGSQPIVSVWDNIIRAKNTFKYNGEANAKGQVIVALPDGSGLNLSKMRELLELSLQIFRITNFNWCHQEDMPFKTICTKTTMKYATREGRYISCYLGKTSDTRLKKLPNSICWPIR